MSFQYSLWTNLVLQPGLPGDSYLNSIYPFPPKAAHKFCEDIQRDSQRSSLFFNRSLSVCLFESNKHIGNSHNHCWEGFWLWSEGKNVDICYFRKCFNKNYKIRESISFTTYKETCELEGRRLADKMFTKRPQGLVFHVVWLEGEEV